jgi:hypothetical protein
MISIPPQSLLDGMQVLTREHEVGDAPDIDLLDLMYEVLSATILLHSPEAGSSGSNGGSSSGSSSGSSCPRQWLLKVLCWR